MIQPGGYIRDILNSAVGDQIQAHGWVKTKTEFPGHYFVKLNDGSCFEELQLVVRKGASLVTASISYIGQSTISSNNEIVARHRPVATISR